MCPYTGLYVQLMCPYTYTGLYVPVYGIIGIISAHSVYVIICAIDVPVYGIICAIDVPHRWH
jgi:hypothetical protein